MIRGGFNFPFRSISTPDSLTRLIIFNHGRKSLAIWPGFSLNDAYVTFSQRYRPKILFSNTLHEKYGRSTGLPRFCLWNFYYGFAPKLGIDLRSRRIYFSNGRGCSRSGCSPEDTQGMSGSRPPAVEAFSLLPSVASLRR